MALNFPSSPSVGDIYQRWTWNGVGWAPTVTAAQPMLPIAGGAITGNLGVAGATTLTGTLTALGHSQINTLDVAGQATFDDGVTIEGDDAATKTYVDEAVAAATTWQGTWDASANAPDLTDVNLHNNGWTWTIDTPDPTASFAIPVTPAIPGLSGVTVWNGDHAIWSSTASAFEIVHGSSLSLQEAQGMFLALSGGTLTAPGNLTTPGTLTTGPNGDVVAGRHLMVGGAGVGGAYVTGTQFNVSIAGTMFIGTNNGAIHFSSAGVGMTSGVTFDSDLTMTGGYSRMLDAQCYFKFGPPWVYIDYPSWWTGVPGYFPYIFTNQSSDLVIGSGSQLVFTQSAAFYNGFYVDQYRAGWVGLMGTEMYISNSPHLGNGYGQMYLYNGQGGTWDAALSCHGNANALVVSASANAINVQNGATVKPGGGSWTAPSDVRTKTDVHEYERGLADLAKLNPIRFRYNGRFRMPETGQSYVGLHAEEVKDVMPEMVRAVRGKLDYDDDEETDILHVDPSDLTFAMLNAIKELTKRLEALEAKLA